MSTNTNAISKPKISVETIAVTGIFTALISVISAIPIGFELFGVPATLQTFAMAFIGYLLCFKLGTAATAVYILLGLIGIPVFNGFHAGPSVLFGATGGFIFGFLFLSFLSGVGLKLSKRFSQPVLKAVIAIVCGFVGLIICHLLGVLQFAVVYKVTIPASFTMVSLPYLPKDAASVVLAYFIAISVRTALAKAKVMPKGAELS
jgi:biotin transport system substrate-specific component